MSKLTKGIFKEKVFQYNFTKNIVAQQGRANNLPTLLVLLTAFLLCAAFIVGNILN